ncbi:MAG TPA: hypothetical protein VGR89_10690, partial [Puia sp.]|nr:hypothetical protein [Puia sp.]
MSDRQNENALRIAAYLENKLSPTEREAFKRALSEDDGLRLQYIDALMNRAETPTSPVAGSIADEEVQTGTGDSGHVESKEGSHPGGEVADEWMGIVRGEEGAREVGMPAVDRTGTGDTGGAGQSEP